MLHYLIAIFIPLYKISVTIILLSFFYFTIIDEKMLLSKKQKVHANIYLFNRILNIKSYPAGIYMLKVNNRKLEKSVKYVQS